MDMKQIGAIGAAVAGILAVGSNLTSILSFFGVSNNENNVNVTVNIDSASLNVQTEVNKGETTETKEVTESVTESVTDIQTEPITEIQTEAVTEVQTELVTEKVKESDDIKAESNFELVNIATFSDKDIFSSGFGSKEEYHWEYYSGFADYDPITYTLYYIDSVYTIKSYNLNSGEEKTVADFNGKIDEIYGLSVFVNHSTGNVYAVIGNKGVYDISNDKWIIEDDFHFGYADNLRFVDSDTFLALFVSDDMYTYSLKKEQSEELRTVHSLITDDRINSNNIRYVSPFLYDDCWYYFGHTSYGGDFQAFIVKTIQLSGESKELQLLGNADDILSYCVNENGVCYLDSNHNIYQFNMEAEHKESTLLSDGTNPDILLVNGGNIKNTATSYLSEPASYMIKISNSKFVFYDCSDNTLKLMKIAE